MKKFIEEQIQTRLKKLDAELHHTAHHPEDAEAIHRLRVAIRRFTQCVRIFEECLDNPNVKKIQHRLRKTMEHCAAVRNCDVAVEVLAQAGVQAPEVVESLKQQRLHAQHQLARRLESGRNRKVLHRWRSLLRMTPPEDRTRGVWTLSRGVSANARSVLPGLAADLWAAGDAATADGAGYQKLHRFRLMSKRLRYTLELFEPVYGDRLQPGMETMRGIQDHLGAINDCVTTLELVKNDRRVALPARRLLVARETEFRAYWARHFGPEQRAWWQTTLGPMRLARKATGKANGNLHPKTWRSGAA